MDIIIIIGAAQAFFLSFIAIGKKHKYISDFMLAFWLAFTGLHLLFYYLFATGILYNHPYLLGIGFCFPMLEGPIMFWYVLVMINESGKFKIKYALHALPFLFSTIFILFDFYFMSDAEKLIYFKTTIFQPTSMTKIVTMLNVFIGPVYVIWSIILLRKFKKSLANKFSYTEKISLNWLKIVLSAIGFVWITVIMMNLFGNSHSLPNENLSDDIIYTSVSFFVFFIGVYGIKQQSIISSIPRSDFRNDNSKTEKQLSTNKRNKQGLEDLAEPNKELTKLVRFIEDEKLFLNPKLNIGDLANSLSMHSHQVSKLINNHLNQNFFEFINDFRVQEFKLQVANPKNKHISILGLALDAGFNSKATFNRIFKNSTGQTPSEFRENYMF